MLHDARGTHTLLPQGRPLPGAILGGFALLVLALVVMGCPKTYSPNERSTEDSGRTGARAVSLQTPVTDAVNYEGGDATDWKQFEAPGAGTMTVEVFFDNHFISASVELYDSYGTRLASTSRTSGSEPSVISHDLPGDGLYFVRVHASANRSVYSIRVYPGSPGGSTEEVVDPRPEFDRPI